MATRETEKEAMSELLRKMKLNHRPNYVDDSGASYHGTEGRIDDNSVIRIDKDIPTIAINGEIVARNSSYKVVRYNSFLAIYGDKIEPTIIDIGEMSGGE